MIILGGIQGMLCSVHKAFSMIPAFICNSCVDSGLAFDTDPLMQNCYAFLNLRFYGWLFVRVRNNVPILEAQLIFLKPFLPRSVPSLNLPSNIMGAVSLLSSRLMMKIKNSTGFSADPELRSVGLWANVIWNRQFWIILPTCFS